jgi:hypothetical protein
MPGGRPSKYNEFIKDNLSKITELYSNGFTDEELAKYFGIHVATIYEYAKKYPEFTEARKKGKMIVDNEVTNSLRKLCGGFVEVEETLDYIPGTGDSKTEVKMVRKHKKYFPPNITAIIWWQSNRQKDRWKRFHSDNIDIEVPKVPEFDSMSDDDLQKFIDKETKKESGEDE